MQDPSLYSQIKAQVQSQPHFQEQEHLKCPRCDSTNTKFCYYNNYNLSQPRHFCKNCRRYWTKGGSLRNIPVGGGTRKNSKRSSSSSSAAAKRAAAAAPPPNAKNECKSSNGEMLEATSPLKGGNFVGQFGNLLEAGGGLSSLLGSNGGYFGNFLDGLGTNGSSLQMMDPGLGQDVDPNNDDGFLNIHGGDSGGGGDGWPDLAMYTPESTFM